ncbi:hypothetical protein EON63_18495 [archaeon]|nr:MAG: hypothetical protein EON63_18495 [archaeon]
MLCLNVGNRPFADKNVQAFVQLATGMREVRANPMQTVHIHKPRTHTSCTYTTYTHTHTLV